MPCQASPVWVFSGFFVRYEACILNRQALYQDLLPSALFGAFLMDADEVKYSFTISTG
jgi:hypothetical protein